MKIVRWGIIGLGSIAEKFAKDLNLVEGASIHAVASRSLEKAERFADRYGASKAYGSYEAMMEDQDIDIVYIATPHSHHYQNTMMCLESGHNVLCEKAFAINKLQVQKMIAKAKEKNLFLMEGLWSRFNPSIQAARQDVLDGKIGSLKAVKADFCFYYPFNEESRLIDKKRAGGALLDIGIYPIFLSYLMLGKPVRMNAEAEYFPNGADKNLVMLFDYQGGEEAILNCSLQYFAPCDGYFYGDEGCIRLHGRWHEATAYTRFEKSMENPLTKGFGNKCLSFQHEIEEVNDCLKAGKKQSDLWSWKNSLELMEILDMVRTEIGLDYGQLESLDL